MIRKSWKSRLPPAWRPPEIMLTIGIGKTGSAGSPGASRCARAGSGGRRAPRPRAAAAAWATASETPSTALAPSRALFGVPSSAIERRVERRPDRRGRSPSTAGGDLVGDVGRRPATPPGRRAGGRRRRGARAPRAARCSPPTGTIARPDRAARRRRLDLDGRTAPRVEHLAGLQFREGWHRDTSPSSIGSRIGP